MHADADDYDGDDGGDDDDGDDDDDDKNGSRNNCNEIEQRVWLVDPTDPTLFFPSPTPPPRLKVDGTSKDVE